MENGTVLVIVDIVGCYGYCSRLMDIVFLLKTGLLKKLFMKLNIFYMNLILHGG